MWLFTQHGMVSIVAHKTEPGMLLVRARSKEHLETLLAPIIFSGYEVPEISRTPEGDYEYRVCISKSAATAMMADAIGEIDYPNFKGRCDALGRTGVARDYADMLHSIWHTVHRTLARNVRKVETGRRRGLGSDSTLAKASDALSDSWLDRYLK